jgi:hypothetical protein
MAEPTGSLRLIWRHTRDRRWTFTTWIVALYLLLNVIGRLSIATLGLTFDTDEDITIEYPVMVTDWGSQDWFSLPVNDFNGDASDYRKYQSTHCEYLQVISCHNSRSFFFIFKKSFLCLALAANRYNAARMNDYAMRGLLISPVGFDDNHPSPQQEFEQIKGLTRVLNESHVIYSYPFREFRGNVSSPSETMVLRSSSSCTKKMINETGIYEIDTYSGQVVKTPTGDLGMVSFRTNRGFLCRDSCANHTLRCLTQITFHPGVSI